MNLLRILIILFAAAAAFSAPQSGLIDTIAPKLEIDPPPGLYNHTLTVNFKSNKSGSIFYYSLDNTPASDKSLEYSGLLTISNEGRVVLRAVAVDLVGNVSRELKHEYTIDTRPPDLDITPKGERALMLRTKVGGHALKAGDVSDGTHAG